MKVDLSKNPLGVMQGRLLPKFQGKYQAHPIGTWQNEFDLAAKLGLDCIEFILDFDQAALNPLLTELGRAEIKRIISNSGVRVLSVCADYFMRAPLHSADTAVAQNSLDVLNGLLIAGSDLGVTEIVLPCVDSSSVVLIEDQDRLVNVLHMISGYASEAKINLALETDLGPNEFRRLLDRLPNSSITVNYDIGNSASLGFNPKDEMEAYGDRISDVHIKDRVRGGKSVPLGAGDAKISMVLDLLSEINFDGPLIMQAFRGELGLPETEEQLDYIKHLMLSE